MAETALFALPLHMSFPSAECSDLLLAFAQEKPILLLAFILTASSRHPDFQLEVAMLFRRVLAERSIVQGQCTLELLQGLLTYLNWYHLRFNVHTQRFYQLMQLAGGMVEDLSLPRSFVRLTDTAAQASQTVVDEARAFLLCYYLTIISDLGFERPTSMYCTEALRSAAQVVHRCGSRNPDHEIPDLVEILLVYSRRRLMTLAGQSIDAEDYRQEMQKWNQRCIENPDAHSSSLTTSLFITAHTLLKSRDRSSPLAEDVHAGLGALDSLLAHFSMRFTKSPKYLVTFGIGEWMHLITALFMLPRLEMALSSTSLSPVAVVRTPLTLNHITAFRQSLANLRSSQADLQQSLRADTLCGWFESILAAVETRAVLLQNETPQKGPIPDLADSRSTAFELVNSFLVFSQGVDGDHTAGDDLWSSFLSESLVT
ncbi:hypothetical protein B0A52_04142 [Exophiala mesophila]|uniref:Transcription factor domain-containing protein n=1 Tax=Exophiala mesophila TaxID=212818 RepID=A0A438NAU0_EXOME|nr:hypothetical protein B0A52_04142 [Exophiala mesophila]